MVMRFVGVQLSIATAEPSVAGVVSDSQEMILKGGQVRVGDVLSSTTIDCIQVADAPHWSVAFQVLVMVPVPMQPVICALSV